MTKHRQTSNIMIISYWYIKVLYPALLYIAHPVPRRSGGNATRCRAAWPSRSKRTTVTRSGNGQLLRADERRKLRSWLLQLRATHWEDGLRDREQWLLGVASRALRALRQDARAQLCGKMSDVPALQLCVILASNASLRLVSLVRHFCAPAKSERRVVADGASAQR